MSTVLTDDSQVIAMLCAPLAVADTKPLTTSEWAKLAERLRSSDLERPAGLVGRSVDEIVAALLVERGLAERIHDLLGRGGTLAFELERLEARGIWMVTRADESYSEHLRKRLRLKSPPVLFGAGPRASIAAGGIAIAGSRDASPDVLEFTATLAGKLACEQVPVLSGAARGVDQAAMASAMDIGGTAVGVVADSLLRLTQQVEIRRLLEEERLTLVTPYAPASRFTVGSAMGRNKLIYCLSDAAVVVATSAGTGGTWAGAVENLRHGWVPIWSWADLGAPPGNRALVEAGAHALLMDEMPPEEVSQWLAAEHLGLPRVEPTEAPTRDEFRAIWPDLEQFLSEPRSEREVADRFGLKLTQARTWLRRIVEEGLGERRTKPVRYVAASRSTAEPQPKLFDVA